MKIGESSFSGDFEHWKPHSTGSSMWRNFGVHARPDLEAWEPWCLEVSGFDQKKMQIQHWMISSKSVNAHFSRMIQFDKGTFSANLV